MQKINALRNTKETKFTFKGSVSMLFSSSPELLPGHVFHQNIGRNNVLSRGEKAPLWNSEFWLFYAIPIKEPSVTTCKLARQVGNICTLCCSGPQNDLTADISILKWCVCQLDCQNNCIFITHWSCIDLIRIIMTLICVISYCMVSCYIVYARKRNQGSNTCI